jgi:3-dehydroquinate synthase
MADASVGGKNGINFLEKKNIIGTFNRPLAVFIYPGFLKTLSKRETRSGYAEIIKHVLLSDSTRWNSIKNDAVRFLDESSREELITHSVKFKSGIVRDDFKEDGNRAILNFGHTIGHAIESFYLNSQQPMTHGESVAAGMISEIYLSNKLSKFPREEMIQVINFTRNVFNDLSLDCNPEDLIPFLYADKKNSYD